jgi:DNA-binding Lrp family transcriptional regulator
MARVVSLARKYPEGPEFAGLPSAACEIEWCRLARQVLYRPRLGHLTERSVLTECSERTRLQPVTPAQSAFIEEMGQFLGGYGMTPMAGRMWGWLLICDPPEQTAADIAEALQASRGAISGTARILTSAGFIRRTTRRGDRREYFSSPPEALDSMLSNASVIYRQLRVIAEHGMAAGGNSASADARLREFYEVAAFIEVEVPRVIDRFLADRAGAQTTAPRSTQDSDGQPVEAGRKELQ